MVDTAKQEIKQCCRAKVQNEIKDMIRERVLLTDLKIQGEGQRCQRSESLEQKYALPLRHVAQCEVETDQAVIIELKLAVEGIGISQESQEAYDQ